MKASLVILDASVITMDPRNPYSQAIAVEKDHVLALGSNNEISRFIGPKTTVIKASGRIVLPGFIDCHVHLMQTGIDMLKIDFSSCNSIDEVKDLIREQVNSSSTNQWIMGTGYNEFNLREKRRITLKELDEIAPNNPVWISRIDHHSGIINSLALKELKFPQLVEGFEIDATSGELTGYIYAQSNSHARQSINKLLDKTTRKKAVRKAVDKILSVGITSIHALEGGSLFLDDDVDIILEEMPNLPIDIKLFYQTTDVQKVIERDLKQIGGCLLIDGSIGSRTAALSEPYDDAPTEYGELYFDKKELEEFVLEAHSKGLQITTHAIGDAAIEQIIGAYEEAQKRNYREDHRHRIEHFSLPGESHIRRSIQEGIVLSIQPTWANMKSLTDEVGSMRLGSKRSQRLYPIATPFLAGAKMCAGSDSPVSKLGPLLGIHGGVNHFRPEERLSRMALISLFTTNAAWAGFEEGIKGKLSPGYLADMVILDEDIFRKKEDQIKDIAIYATITHGIVRYKIEQ